MKILYIITQGDFGGAQKYVYELAIAAKEKRESVVIAIGRSKDRGLVEKLKQQSIDIVELNYLVREISPLNDILAVFELMKIYQKHRPDVIHLNSSKADIVGSTAFSWWQNKANSRLIFTVHGWYFNEPMSRLKKLFFIWLEKNQAKAKHKFICVSELDRKLGLDNSITTENKIMTIHNGIEIAENIYLPKQLSIEKIFGKDESHEEKKIGIVANFYSSKGLKYLIEAADILVNQQKKHYKFVLIGDGPLRDELERSISKLNLKKSFLLLGKIDRAQSLLKAFDVCVSSSIKEGLPFYILEVMASGVPIIATKVGGIPEVINHMVNGILIEPKNSNKIAEAIDLVLNDNELSLKITEQAKYDVKERFSKIKMIEKTFDLYKKSVT